jgi:carbonic anhydrase
MQIRVAVTKEDWEQIKNLFREYMEWIRDKQNIDLSFQGIEDELRSLPGTYSPPEGCTLLAEVDGQIAGCVALRPFDSHSCEMKRMFVRPAFRRLGLGKALAEQIIQEAKSRGYHLMRLDTADTMQAAQELYRSMGFKPAQQYYDLPPEILKRAVFMELPLL